MKKILLLSAIFCFLITYQLDSQSLLNKLKSAVSKEITGDQGATSKPDPEPKCACDNARLVIELGGKLKLDYKEISVSLGEDGSILVKDRIGGKFYVVKDGTTQGPYGAEDPQIKSFRSAGNDSDNSQGKVDWASMYPDYISQSGEKFLIKFSGKSYGPFAIISDFAVSRTKNKFAAVVTENILVTEDQSKKMEEAIKNAKTDQERMEISMKYGQQISEQMMKGGGMNSIQAKLVSNVPGAAYDPVKWMGGKLNGKVKFDDIVILAQDKVLDLQGNTVLTLAQNNYNFKNLFINSSNTKYAAYSSGALTLSDNTSLTDLFNPYLTKTDGKVFLNYMYYSPGKNAIMQCAIPF